MHSHRCCHCGYGYSESRIVYTCTRASAEFTFLSYDPNEAVLLPLHYRRVKHGALGFSNVYVGLFRCRFIPVSKSDLLSASVLADVLFSIIAASLVPGPRTPISVSGTPWIIRRRCESTSTSTMRSFCWWTVLTQSAAVRKWLLSWTRALLHDSIYWDIDYLRETGRSLRRRYDARSRRLCRQGKMGIRWGLCARGFLRCAAKGARVPRTRRKRGMCRSGENKGGNAAIFSRGWRVKMCELEMGETLLMLPIIISITTPRLFSSWIEYNLFHRNSFIPSLKQFSIPTSFPSVCNLYSEKNTNYRVHFLLNWRRHSTFLLPLLHHSYRSERGLPCR